MKKTIIILLFAAVAVFGVDSLKPQGKTVKLEPLNSYTILTPEKRTEQERVAANMLADYLKRATGIQLKIMQEPEKPEGNIIHVGETVFAKSLGKAPARQSYSIAVKDGQLVIRGGVYGVIALLEEDFGIRWYHPKDHPVIPKLNQDSLAIVPRNYTPVFEVREPLFQDAWGKNGWAAFNRLQPISYFYKITEEMGGGFGAASSGHRGMAKYFTHTYESIIPAKKYFASHPEYFPLKSGKRFPSSAHDGQLCYTCRGLAQAMAEEIKSSLKIAPECRVFAISTNDNLNYDCECADCQKVIKSDGITGAALLLANRVAEDIAKTVPDIRIIVLCYQRTQDPELLKTISPGPNTVAYYAPIVQRAGSLQYLPWYDVPLIARQFAGWKKISRRFYARDYIHIPAHFPFPNMDVFDRNVKYWRDMGATGVFLESAIFCLNSLQPLKNWTFTKKLWNPDWEMDSLIDEFITGYYGAAASEMREYVAFQRKKWKDFYENYKPGDNVTFTSADRKFMQDLLEKAYEKSPDAKIASELCCFYAMTLTACTKNNSAEYEENLKRVCELLTGHKLKMSSNPKRNKRILGEWKEQLAEFKSGRSFPVYCDESIVLKKRSLWCGVKEMECTGAYTGKVPRQFAKTDWGVQWQFTKLIEGAPNQGVYVARMRIKPDFKKQYKGNDKAFSLHVVRKGIKESFQGRYVRFSEIKVHDWQYVYLYKVYMNTPGLTGYFYNCIGNLAEGDGIFYDLIEFIPVEQFKDKKLAESLPKITL